MPKVTHYQKNGVVIVTDDRTIEDAKAEAKERITQQYQMFLNKGFTYKNKPLQIDSEAIMNMNSMINYVLVGNPLPPKFSWKMSDNTYLPVTKEELFEMASLAAQCVMTLRIKFWAAKDGAANSQTNDEADSFNIE